MQNIKIKDYDSIEESQKIKDSNDMGSDERIKAQPKNNYKPLFIIIFALVLFFCFIIFLFIIQLNKLKSKLNYLEFKKEQLNPPVSQNFTNVQKDLNQSVQKNENQINSLNQNLQSILDEALNQTFNVIHKKRNQTNISISELLPKIKSINNISEILKSKTLNIKNKKITKEYIQFLKPLNESIENKYRQILFPNLSFDNYSFVHIHNYSIYLSYLIKTSNKNDTKKKDNHKFNKTKNLKKIKVNIRKKIILFFLIKV
jgi:hypothetical protein